MNQKPISGYEYEIFLSYKWRGEVQGWVNKILVKILRDIIFGVNPNVRIFKDTEKIEPGDSLTESLRRGLITSKCLISVITPPYFVNSQWCTMEFSTLHHRERQLGFRTDNNPKGLIFPIVFVDVDDSDNPIDLEHEYPEAYKLAKSFTPLYLDRNKYLHDNNAFKESAEYNQLVNLIRKWLTAGILARINDTGITWREDFRTPEWLEAPYTAFLNQYLRDANGNIIGQPVIR